MTNEERYIAQGRARDEAKRLKAEIATLRTFFDEYSERLQATKDVLARFLENPSGHVHSDRLFIDSLNALQRELCTPGFFSATAEFLEQNNKLKKLEDLIKDF